MSLVQYVKADGYNRQVVTEATPLPVSATVDTAALEALIGPLDATKVTDPDAASATLLALVRGLISIVASETTLGDVLTELQSQATSIPHFALDATSDLTRTFGSGSTAAEASLVAAVSGQTTKVHRITATMAGAGYITLLDGSGGTELFRLTFPAAGAYVIDFDPRPYAKTTANTALYWARSAAVASTIQVWTVTSA